VTRPVRVAHIATVDLTLRHLLLPQLLRLRDEGYEVASISAPGPWVAGLEADGIRHIPWRHVSRSWDPVADLRAFGELLRILRAERFDLVHTHTPKPGILGRVAARLVGVPVVVNTVHGLYATPEDPPGRRLAVLSMERLAARFSDLELYQSEEDLRWARRIGLVGPSRSALLGNGTDLSRFSPGAVSTERLAELRRELGIPEGSLVVGTIGRLVAEKGYRELFAAARRVRAELPDVRFLAAGGYEPAKADAIPEAEVARAGEDVVFAGWRRDVPNVLALMDVFVLPSWREGLPRSAVEAAAMGKPLVLTDIRGCREVVRHGIEGLLVPARDPGRLAKAIGRLAGDGALRERLGAAARARAVERFDERRVEEIVVRAYRRLLASKGRVGLRTASSPEDVRIRSATRQDTPAMARLHREGLPNAFLPLLGDRFLRLMYRAMVADAAAITLVAENGRGVVGFAAGAASVEDFYRRFRRRHGISAAVAAAPRLLSSRIRRRLRETADYTDRTEGLPDAELLAIAVDPAHASRGIGRALAGGVLDGLAERGADEVRVTVAASNSRANRFYEWLGFRLVRRIAVHDGVPSNVLVIRWRS
jgi:glycosyltransferase involved in cell wall biosynthesis/ribosomal protein S18 acetylase RimI-like enzyme